jgi:hypothetical protein
MHSIANRHDHAHHDQASNGQADVPPEPVTSQVTTMPGSGRRSATCPDADMRLTSGEPTQPDAIGRNRHVW